MPSFNLLFFMCWAVGYSRVQDYFVTFPFRTYSVLKFNTREFSIQNRSVHFIVETKSETQQNALFFCLLTSNKMHVYFFNVSVFEACSEWINVSENIISPNLYFPLSLDVLLDKLIGLIRQLAFNLLVKVRFDF